MWYNKLWLFGFGYSNTKPKNNTILDDAENAINFSLSDLKYKKDI